jgi:hypothetical protein
MRGDGGQPVGRASRDAAGRTTAEYTGRHSRVPIHGIGMHVKAIFLEVHCSRAMSHILLIGIHIYSYMNWPNNYRHHIHRDTLESITNTIISRCTSGIRTHLGKIKVHNHYIGNDLADALAKLVVDGHPPHTT